MKVTIEKSDFTHEVLVDLFSTALYGNPSFGCYYDSFEYHDKCKVDESDCYEDKIAKLLLAGCSIEIADEYAEDEKDVYGDKKATWSTEYEIMMYPITLDDIVEGLNKAANDGQVQRVESLLNLDGDIDMIDADALMQYIVYGDIIYG